MTFKKAQTGIKNVTDQSSYSESQLPNMKKKRRKEQYHYIRLVFRTRREIHKAKALGILTDAQDTSVSLCLSNYFYSFWILMYS